MGGSSFTVPKIFICIAKTAFIVVEFAVNVELEEIK